MSSRAVIGILGAAFAATAFSTWESPRVNVAPPAREHHAEVAPCATLTSRLCARYGETARECKIATSEAKGYDAARCATLLTRFDAVAIELERLAEGAELLTAREQRLVHGEAPSLGAPDARVVLVEFADFECSECGRASLMAGAIKSQYGERVRLVFRQFPLPEHPQARLAAEASLAAHAQGKFWEYHDILFGNPHDLSRPALERYASEIGLDMTAFRKALDQKQFAADVDADIELARKVFAAPLPALYANGKRVSVAYGAQEFADLVAAAEADESGR
jgi:protein-disulfide isomerase